MATAADRQAKIGVLGASGYTGAELVRLLLRHPRVEIALLTADRRAGQEMREVFPQFSPYRAAEAGRRSRASTGRRPGSIWSSAPCRTPPRRR